MADMSASDLIRDRQKKVSNLSTQGVGEMFANRDPNSIKKGLLQMQESGNPFASGGSDLIGGKASDIYNKRLGNIRGSLLRNAVFDQAALDDPLQQIANEESLRQDQLRAIEDAKKAAARAKRSGLTSGLLGLAGAAGGAYLGSFAGQGAAGAQIGGGLGSIVGGLR